MPKERAIVLKFSVEYSSRKLKTVGSTTT